MGKKAKPAAKPSAKTTKPVGPANSAKPATKPSEKISKPVSEAKSTTKKVSFADVKPIADAWVKEYANALNQNAKYARAAKGWGVSFDGSLMFVMEKSGEVDTDINIFIDLKDGKCLDARLLAPGENPPRKPGMTLRCPLWMWKQVAFKEIEPISAIMQNKMKLEGDMKLAMRYASAAMELANTVEKTDRTLFTKFNIGKA
nr:SCP2 sterol-binding domain-containing protein [Candidatus Sigynarchaeota archaeon]